MDIEKSPKEDIKFKDRLTLFIKLYILAIILGFLVAVYGVTHENTWEKLGNLLIMTTSVAATIIMVYFIALQTNATRDMAKTASSQTKLTYDTVVQMREQIAIMGETLMEMKKERMNIEYIKNEVVGYIKTIENILGNSLREARPAYSELPLYSKRFLHSNLVVGTSGLDLKISGWMGYQSQGLEERLKRKIQKILEEYNINLEEYNLLVKTVNRLRRKAIDALKKESELVDSLQRISQDGAKKFNIKDAHIIKADTLLEELVTLFNIKESNQLSAPPYGRLGLNSEQERFYGLEVWNKAKQKFYEFLKGKPKVYNDLVTREEDLKKLEVLARELLERIHKMEEELLQSEDKLEKKLMEL